MDSITQATLGALCGELLLRKQLGWKGAAWGLFLGTLPDLDIIASPGLGSMDYLRNHRGLSHSIFLILLASPLLGLLLARLHSALSKKRAIAFVLITWASHVLIDCYNSYGTQIFEPFSDYRVSLDNISIIDPLFTAPMFIGILVALFLKKDSRARSVLIITITSWVTLYSLASFGLQHLAQKKFDARLEAAGISADDKLSACTLGNIFLWRMLARDSENYYVSYWSVFDAEDRPISVDTIPRHPEISIPYQKSKAFETLDWFSKGWWHVLPAEADSIVFIDMRFGEMHQYGGDSPRRVPPFTWRLTQNEDGSISDDRVSTRGNFQPKPTLQHLWDRICGRAPDWMDSPWPWNQKTKKDL